jgi:hypothetical protein
MSTTKPIHIHLKSIAIILLAIIALSATSCSKENDDSGNQGNSTTSCASLQNQYDIQEGYLTGDIRRYKKATNASLRQSILKSIRATQNLMRIIRQKAAKNGCSFTKSSYENWNP